MKKLYIDGSARGMTVGCGIAIVDSNCLVEPLSSYKYMPTTGAIHGEYYSMYEALRIIQERKYRVAVINTDNEHFFSMFEKNNGIFIMKKPVLELPEHLQPLVNSIHNLLYIITKNSRNKLVVEKTNDNDELETFYRNIAHYESRRYLSEVDDIYLSTNELLFQNDIKTKSKLNKISSKVKTFKEILKEDSVVG